MNIPGDALGSTRRLNLRFEYFDPPLTLSVLPAVGDLNPLYIAAAARLAPYELSAALPEDHPRRLTEERAEELLLPVFAEAVIAGSDDPAHEGWGPDEWVAWLAAHRDEFRSIREVAEHRRNFVTEAEDQAREAASAELGLLRRAFGGAA